MVWTITPGHCTIINKAKSEHQHEDDKKFDKQHMHPFAETSAWSPDNVSLIDNNPWHEKWSTKNSECETWDTQCESDHYVPIEGKKRPFQITGKTW